ncbi:MAG: hypothetical protein AB4058_14515 [Microcystaceae cyanobacterium]
MQGADLPPLIDPTLLRSARRIYRNFCVLHPRQTRRPFGIAIHRNTHRGQLIFNNHPILLPGECFVPLKQLESEQRY